MFNFDFFTPTEIKFGKEAEKEYFEESEFPEVKGQRLEQGTIPRYSTTQDRKMYLKGVKGLLELEGCSEKVMKYLYAMVPYVISEDELVKVLGTMKEWFAR